MKLLLVEDDDALRQQLVSALKAQNYVVEEAPNGEEALYLAREYQFDLGIFDLGLPDISGMEVISTLRDEDVQFPVLILTARGHWQDKVDGLAAGADDYLVKPFQTEELLARINALLRRASGYAKPEIVKGPISLNSLKQEVKVNGQVMDLTAYEYKVLEYLMLNPDKVVSKTELTEHLYAQDYDRDSNVLEVFVGRLRKKIDPDGTIKPIDTLRGRGYRLRADL
ncbi:DNA-binding response regulator [Kangiella profundi]|uniref:DNA-binding response regulator n=2 Tax=Kangiella profundi TaxID=1561924 RepID=A0A2K9ABX3_9GAMM|nr:response regulator transcription factor [Kangiella profundi]AUD78927.1 DNA-binding response regulator [Kangiella profundi]MBD3666925.1 response regulator transcription factor [Kangiella sp.]GGF02932.1 DNA-binding response regulator [Kangiella profundi]